MKSLVGSIASSLARVSASAPVPYVTSAPGSRLYPAATSGGVSTESELRAMSSVGTLFAIVSTLATSTGGVTWRLWASPRGPEGEHDPETEVTRHAALDVWNKPNPFMGRQLLTETVQQHVDLCGEGALAVVRSAFAPQPIELWPLRPDRLIPVPDPHDFLVGYVYAGPDGERYPLRLDEVMRILMPNPMDPYRGLGPVQAIMADLDSVRFGSEWNRNFFRNSAQPGGVLEVEDNPSQPEWEEFTERWRTAHQGVANAGRVAILPAGTKWVDRQFSQRDMQFAELSKVSRDVIREAFGIHGHKLGMSESVNRANADAADVTYARDKIVPRLERFRQMLNGAFLPMFGATSFGLEFDYDNPVPDDDELAAKLLTARANAASTLVGAGFAAPEVLAACQLPEIPFSKPEPKVIAPPPGAVPQDAPIDGPPEDRVTALWRADLRRALDAADARPEPDLQPVQDDWVRALDAIMAKWPGITADQRTELRAQIIAAIDGNDLAALGALTADSGDAARAIEQALLMLAQTAGEQVVAEAAAQDVTLHPQMPPAGSLAATAAALAAITAAAYAVSAAREALRIHRPGDTGHKVADAVMTFLKESSDAGPRTEIGGALTSAQNSARLATFIAGPTASLYASEKLDQNTCKFCRAVDGRYLGSTADGQIMDEVLKTYPMGALGGYVDCLGRTRCRGTITGVWRKGSNS